MNIQSLSMESSRPDSRVRKPAHEEIAALAYQLHIGGGGQVGASLEDWLFAEYVLTELQAAAAGETSRGGAVHPVSGVPIAKQETSPAHVRESRKTPRPVRQDPTCFPLAASAPGRHPSPERPGAYAVPSNSAQPPAMAPLELATAQAACSDRWRGINE